MKKFAITILSLVATFLLTFISIASWVEKISPAWYIYAVCAIICALWVVDNIWNFIDHIENTYNA